MAFHTLSEDSELRREIYAWNSILAGAQSVLLHRALSGAMPDMELRDTADALEGLVRRIRRRLPNEGK
jgi:hypothetical protein